MEGEVIFLGTGTSMGVPTLGCECAVCTAPDPRDKRLRPSILVRWRDAGGCERTAVIDTTPDFRTQALNAGVRQLDAVFYTHSHADHILGFDDLRPLSFEWFRAQGPIPLYVTAETRATLMRVFDYTLAPDATYANRARVVLQELKEHNLVHGVDFVPVPVLHGDLEITGYRIGSAAYLTDVSGIPEKSFALLEGLDLLVLSALRHKPHYNHLTLAQAMELAERIGAGQTYFTHIAHELGHAQTNALLPHGMELAYDGLRVKVRLG
jgi:phosphoribosyl 1,2-cyclic phosphate phosphodiesterase